MQLIHPAIANLTESDIWLVEASSRMGYGIPFCCCDVQRDRGSDLSSSFNVSSSSRLALHSGTQNKSSEGDSTMKRMLFRIDPHPSPDSWLQRALLITTVSVR